MISQFWLHGLRNCGDTGAVVAADIHRGDGGDTTTLGPTLAPETREQRIG